MTRDIYSYTAAGSTRHADPLRVNRTLWGELDGKFDRVLTQSQDEEPAVHYPAQDQLVAAVRVAFDLPEIDPHTGAGFLDREVLQVLSDYLAWMHSKKKPSVTSR